MAGLAAVAGGDDLAELVDGHALFAYLKEGADDSAHHVAQEAVGGDEEGVFRFGVLDPSRLADVADGSLDIGVRAAKRGEVLTADQPLCGLVHGLEVESGRYAGVVDIEERILAGGDPIAVGAGDGIKPCVRHIDDAAEVSDGDRGRQEVVESRAKIGGQMGRIIEMRYHLLGMDSCVGATGEGEGYGLAEDGGKSRFHLRLYRVSIRLRLRAVEGSAVI